MDGLLRLIAEARDAELQYNPYLRTWERAQPNAESAGKGEIERPGDGQNIIWQNRRAAPSEAEYALADALEQVLGDGAETLAQITGGLNAHNLLAPDGAPWTEETLAAELQRLGA